MHSISKESSGACVDVRLLFQTYLKKEMPSLLQLFKVNTKNNNYTTFEIRSSFCACIPRAMLQTCNPDDARGLVKLLFIQVSNNYFL